MRLTAQSTVTGALALLGLAFAIDVARAQPPALDARLLLEHRVSMLIPRGFAPMSQELLIRKYPSANRPNLVYSNAATTINVALEHTAHRLPAAQLAAGHTAIRNGLASVYPSAEWFRNELRPINGRQFFYMELRTPAVDTPIRNIIVGTSLDDRLLLVSFNVTRALEAEWMPVGYKIIESIRVN